MKDRAAHRRLRRAHQAEQRELVSNLRVLTDVGSDIYSAFSRVVREVFAPAVAAVGEFWQRMHLSPLERIALDHPNPHDRLDAASRHLVGQAHRRLDRAARDITTGRIPR
jgi:hypothetical protein